MIQILSVPQSHVSYIFLGIFIEFSFIAELTFKTPTFFLSFVLWFLASLVWNSLLIWEKKRRIHIIKNLFILLLKTKTLKNTQLSTVCFCYYFNAILLCALMLWITKHLPWLLYIFLHVFLFLWYSFFFFFSSILVFASVMVFDLFLKCRADWLSIFLSWRCLRSSMKHSGSTHF